ncbi:MAG: RING finger protein 10 [Paramarteilia canceri]
MSRFRRKKNLELDLRDVEDELDEILNHHNSPGAFTELEEMFFPSEIKSFQRSVYYSGTSQTSSFIPGSRQVIISNHTKNIQYLHHNSVVIPWSHVALIETTMNNDFCCAICMDVPTTPRILECSHVFCLICLSSLVALSEISKCPICQEQFMLDDSKMLAISRILYKQEDKTDKNKTPYEFDLKQKYKNFSLIFDHQTTDRQGFISTTSLDTLSQANIQSKYASITVKKLQKMIESEQDIVLQHFDCGDMLQGHEKAFEIVMNHFEFLNRTIETKTNYKLDIANLVNDDIDLSIENQSVHNFYQCFDLENVIFASFLFRMIIESNKQPPKKVFVQIEEILQLYNSSGFDNSLAMSLLSQSCKKHLKSFHMSYIPVVFANTKSIEPYLTKKCMEKYTAYLEKIKTKIREPDKVENQEYLFFIFNKFTVRKGLSNADYVYHEDSQTNYVNDAFEDSIIENFSKNEAENKPEIGNKLTYAEVIQQSKKD